MTTHLYAITAAGTTYHARLTPERAAVHIVAGRVVEQVAS